MLHGYRPDIDGLRAIAVLSVIIYHAYPSLLTGGYVGVDIFFVISGFLISGIITDELRNGRFSFMNFYVRRIRRIFPALILVLSATLLFGWFALLPDELKELGKHTLAGVFFVSNLILWGEAGYFDRAAELKPLLHLWSLGVEEQFYIFWPLMLWLCWRRLPITAVIAALLVSSFIVNIAMVESHRIAAFYSPLSRMWELATGALLAQLVHMPYWERQVKLRSWCDALKHFVSIGGFGIIIMSLIGLGPEYTFPGWWALLPVLGTVLIISAGASAHYLNRVLLANPVVVWFGKISYPLYLWHWPVLAFTRIVTSDTPPAEVQAAAVIISVILAALTTHLFEPYLRFGLHSRKKAGGLAIAMFVIAIAGTTLFRSDGYADRPSLQLAHTIVPSDDVSPHNKENCAESVEFPYRKLNNDFFCMRSSNSKSTPTTVIVGDSHAFPMYFGLYEHTVSSRRERLLMVGAPGCPPILHNIESFEMGSQDRCRKLMEALLDQIEHDPNISDVVLVARGPLYISGVGYGDVDKHNRVLRRYERTSTETNSDLFVSGMEKTILTMQAANKHVFIVLSPPELGFEPKECFNRRPLSFSSRGIDNCGVSYSDYLARSGQYRRAMHALIERIPDLKVIDPELAICDRDYCRAYLEGQLLYGDNNHLSPSGARWVIKQGINIASQAHRMGATRN